MLYLYVDESGDLGFDFVTKKPSKFFTITVLALKGQDKNRALINAVKHTLKRKLGEKKLLKIPGRELKGRSVSIEVKKYFYEQVKDIDFKLYALTLNKKRAYQSLTKQKEWVYNYIARLVLDKISFQNTEMRINLILDKSKSKTKIAEFNSSIFREIQSKIDPKIPLSIVHALSHESLGLQAVDLFSWGIFRKYEREDVEWFQVFRNKISYDNVYSP